MSEDSDKRQITSDRDVKKVDEKIKPVIATLTAQGQFGSSWTGIPFNYIVAKSKK